MALNPLTLRQALLLVLDQVDYTQGACHFTDMVGACLPVGVIDRAREALDADKQRQFVQPCAHSWRDYGSLGGRNVIWCAKCDALSFVGKE